jgi:hypothetical protein
MTLPAPQPVTVLRRYLPGLVSIADGGPLPTAARHRRLASPDLGNLSRAQESSAASAWSASSTAG